MNNIIKTFLILSVLIGSAHICQAQVVSAEKFKSLVVQQAKKDLQKYNIDDSEISVGHLPVSSFTLPDGKISVEIVSGSNNLSAREFKKININVNGKYARTYYAPIETKAFKHVAVAKEVIQRDKIVPLQAVEFKRMDVVGNLENTVSLDDISKELVENYDGKVPASIDELVKFKGVGRKTANLVMAKGFGIPAICVDVHVHRISNRLGWVKTKTPEETEMELRKLLPEKYWLDINTILVTFGQNLCKPQRPMCETCPVQEYCESFAV